MTHILPEQPTIISVVRQNRASFYLNTLVVDGLQDRQVLIQGLGSFATLVDIYKTMAKGSLPSGAKERFEVIQVRALFKELVTVHADIVIEAMKSSPDLDLPLLSLAMSLISVVDSTDVSNGDRCLMILAKAIGDSVGRFDSLVGNYLARRQSPGASIPSTWWELAKSLAMSEIEAKLFYTFRTSPDFALLTLRASVAANLPNPET